MNTFIPTGTRVEAHPHRPRVLKFREGGDDRTVSVRPTEKGGRVSYAALLMLRDATFAVQPAGPKRVREVTGVRDVHAFVRGEVALCFGDPGDSQHFNPLWLEGADPSIREHVLVSYNPFKADHFYEVIPTEDGGHRAGRKVLAADFVIMKGGDLHAVNPTFEVERCDAEAKKGTGTGVCDAPLDEHGNCPRAGSHV